MKFIGSIIAVLLVSGCCNNTILPEPIEVKVLVPVPCVVENIEKPVMPMDTITGIESPIELLKKGLAELELRIGYESKLEAALLGCKLKK